MRIIALTAAAAFSASCASAQNAASGQGQTAQTPPCATELFRQFDFWVGAWEVFGLNDQKAGDNTITVEENGCLLVERWTSVGGGTGQSYNFVDLGTMKWRQVWVSAGATIDYSGGLDADGAMALQGEIAYPNGSTAPFKGTWTLQDDGSVKQHFQQFNSETKEWTDWFIGVYRKQDAKEE